MLGRIRENAEVFLRNLGLREQNHALIGLDINTAYIKLLKINSSVKPYKLESFLIAPTPADAIVKDEIKNPQAISNTINELVQNSYLASKSVAIAVPRSRVLTKSILVDKRMTREEIENRAWFEVNKHFPELAGQIYLDFNLNTERDDNQADLTLVVCRKSQIDPYLEILSQTELVPIIVDVNCFALERAIGLTMPSVKKLETFAILNINETMSSLVVIHQDKMVHAHDQSFDGERVIKQTDAYFANKEPSQDNEEVDPAYEAILKENFISHLRHTMHFFYSSRPQLRIQQIILGGDLACVPKLNLFIQKEMNTDTIIAKPFEDMAIGTEVSQPDLKKHGPSLLECCGLALSKPVEKL